MSTEDSFSFRVLDTLVNAPSSVAGIYADFVYLLGFDAHQVLEPLRQTLDLLEQRGWAHARLQEGGTLKQASGDDRERCWKQYASWLSSAARADLAADEIGLWYGITDEGRTAWSAWAEEPEGVPWELDDDAVKCVVTVIAENEETAERRLAEWLAARGGPTAARKEVSPVAEVQLRSGRVLSRGVRLKCTYAEPASG